MYVDIHAGVDVQRGVRHRFFGTHSTVLYEPRGPAASASLAHGVSTAPAVKSPLTRMRPVAGGEERRGEGRDI